MPKKRFLNLHVLSYARISTKSKAKIKYPQDLTPEIINNVDLDQGIMIFFPEGYPYVQFEGNQELGKTSLANAIVEIGGGEAPANAKNTEDQDKKAYTRVWGKDGNLYDVAVTRSGVTLYQIETEGGAPKLNQKNKEIRMEVSSPKTRLAEVVGPTGISPLKLAELEPKKQVEWIRSLYKLNVEALALEAEINQKYSKAFTERTEAGRLMREKDAALKQNDYYNRREHWQLELDKKNDVGEEEIRRISDQNAEYTKAQHGLQALKEATLPHASQQIKTTEDSIADKEVKIIELKRQIALLKADIGKLEDLKSQQKREEDTIKKRIATGEKWLEDNKHIPEAYANISRTIQAASDRKMQQAEYNHMLQVEKEYNRLSDDYVRLTNAIDEYRAAKRKFIEQFSPDIKDFEVCVPDEEDQRTGLFYKGKPLSHLSESQQWEWFTMLCKQANIQIIVVENINALGTTTVKKFNEFARKGGYIFATMMNRAEKELTISFNTKIPE